MSCSPSEIASTEALSLPALEEQARAACADLARQQKRLDALVTAFGKQKGTVAPQAYAVMQAEISQQELITQAAEQASAAAERDLSDARLEYEREQAQTLRAQRLREIDAALTAANDEINLLQALTASIPERLAKARWEHSNLLRERAQLIR